MSSNSVVAQAKQELLQIQEPMIIHKTGTTSSGHSTFTNGVMMKQSPHGGNVHLMQSRK